MGKIIMTTLATAMRAANALGARPVTRAEAGNDDMSDEDGGSPRYNNPVATRAEPDSDFDEA